MSTAPIEFTVRDACGAYTTSRVQGMQASCTYSAAEAALRLGKKVLGERLESVQLISAAEAVQRWCMLPKGDAP